MGRLHWVQISPIPATTAHGSVLGRKWALLKYQRQAEHLQHRSHLVPRGSRNDCPVNVVALLVLLSRFEFVRKFLSDSGLTATLVEEEEGDEGCVDDDAYKVTTSSSLTRVVADPSPSTATIPTQVASLCVGHRSAAAAAMVTASNPTIVVDDSQSDSPRVNDKKRPSFLNMSR